MSSESGSNSRRYLGLVPAAILLAAGIASFVAQRYVFVPTATHEDYERAATYILAHKKPDDAIRVYPTWTETPYPYLVEAKMDFVRQDEPVYSDVQRFERIWLLAEAGMRDDALASLPFDAMPSDGSKSFDTTEVLLVEVPDYPEFRDELRLQLEDAKVTRVKGDHVIRCNNWSEDKQRWDCGPREDRWIYVGDTIREMDNDPRRCIWAHAPPNYYWVQTKFPDIEMGDRFQVRAGPTANAWRSDRGPELEFELEIDGRVKRHVFPPKTQAWRAVELDTSQMKGEKKDVLVRVRAKEIWDRFFCFNGWAVDEAN